MKVDKKSVNVKGYGNKRHEISIEKTTIGHHNSVSLKKNGNVILNTTPDQLKKLKSLFE